MLENLQYWHWWGVAAFLGAIEMLMPTTFLLWPAIGAALVGLVMMGPQLTWQNQVVLFVALTVGSAVAGRTYLRRRKLNEAARAQSRRGRQYIGREFVIEEPVTGGKAVLTIDETIWSLAGEGLETGQRVEVVEAVGTQLKVKRVEPDDPA